MELLSLMLEASKLKEMFLQRMELQADQRDSKIYPKTKKLRHN